MAFLGGKASNFLLAIAMFATIAPSAHGYIDGGTGSYLLQMLIAGTLGGIFVAKNWLTLAKAKLARKPRQK